MIISRKGYSKNHGNYKIDINPETVSWNAINNSIEIKASGIQDFDTESKHNYTISIPLPDIADIISILGQDAVNESPRDLESALGVKSKALNRLVYAASGLVNTSEKKTLPMPPSKAQ